MKSQILLSALALVLLGLATGAQARDYGLERFQRAVSFAATKTSEASYSEAIRPTKEAQFLAAMRTTDREARRRAKETYYGFLSVLSSRLATAENAHSSAVAAGRRYRGPAKAQVMAQVGTLQAAQVQIAANKFSVQAIHRQAIRQFGS